MKTRLFTSLFISYLVFFFCSLNAQQLDLELQVLDLEINPAFEKDVIQTFVSGGKVYIVTEYSGDNDLLVFDGNDKELILEDSEEDLKILGELNDGLVMLIGSIASIQHLYFLDHSTSSLTLLYELPGNFKSAAFLEEVALILTWGDDLFVTNGTPSGSQLLWQFGDIPQDEELQHQVDNKVILEGNNQVWVSDGTLPGTFALSDFSPGHFGHRFVEAGGLIFYSVNDVLWRTDGTLPGTMALDNIGISFTDMDHLTSTNNGILFMGRTDEYGKEVWGSDGTNEGTQLLMDITPGPESGFDESPQSFINTDNLMIFRGAGTHDWEVWKSDGSANGTTRIIDFTGQPGYNDFTIYGFHTTQDGKQFFLTRNNLEVTVLWTYDNSMTEALQVATLPKLFITAYSSGSKLYFEFYEGGDQLWVTDGTVDGTIHLGTFSLLDIIGTHNDLLFFTYNSSPQDYGYEPHVSDGTIAGTGLLKDINEGIGWSEPDAFFVYDNTCFFYAEDHIAGQSFYTTDGTESGTQLSFDLYPNTLGSNLKDLTAVSGKLYFINNGNLWVSDGTQNGSLNLQHSVNFLDVFGQINGKMLFISGSELWVTDGTLGGTQLLLPAGGTSFHVNTSIKMNNKLWFFYDDGNNGIELYNSDGTANGTAPAFESVAGSGSIFDMNTSFPETNGALLFFSNNDGINGFEPWVSDGTLSGTTLLKDLSNDAFSSYPESFTRFKDKVFFHQGAGRLWVSDGTEEGTIELGEATIERNASTGIIGDDLIFRTFNHELWKTDGTAEGTQLIYDPDIFISKLIPYKNKVIFYGDEPWITDGTSEGTHIIKDIDPDNDSNPNYFTAVEELMFFSADQPFEQLWQTDGTEMGTIAATNLDFRELNDPEHLTMHRGKLFFIGYGATFGEEIYYFDLNQSENIKGQIYHDSDSNGQQDSNESGINNTAVVAYNGEEIISYTDADGNFEFFGLEGEYEVYPFLNQCWEISSDPSSYDVNVGTDLIAGLNFGFEKISSEESVRSQINAAPTRCGFTVPFWINITNTGCDTIAGEIAVELDELVEFVDANHAPTTVDGNTYVWNFNELHISDVHQIQLNLQMPDEQSVGESITLSSKVFLLNDDNELILSDEYAYSSSISCAIDPNDKQVKPDRSNLSAENYTLFEEKLTYTIRFQNTGTDTAFTVKIRDTLSPLLDLQTFEPIVASHPFRTTIYPGRIVEFLFEDILLPDSIVNEPKSHGFVIFQINTLNGIEEFSEVSNTAHIYFDYNGAVVTNTVTNTMVSTFDSDEDGFNLWEDCNDTDPEINPDAIEIPGNQIDENCDGEILTSIPLTEIGTIHVFPNPTLGQLKINLGEKMDLYLKLSNPNGKVLYTQDFNASLELNLTILPAGIYFLEIGDTDSGYRMVRKVIKME